VRPEESQAISGLMDKQVRKRGVPEQSNPPLDGPSQPPPPHTYGSPSSLTAAETMPEPEPLDGGGGLGLLPPPLTQH